MNNPWIRPVQDPADWGDVVPDVKRSRNRLDGALLPETYEQRTGMPRNRRTVNNPYTGIRTLEQLADDYATGKIQEDQMQEFMGRVSPEAKRRLYLDMLAHPPDESFVDKAPINPHDGWSRRQAWDYKL